MAAPKMECPECSGNTGWLINRLKLALAVSAALLSQPLFAQDTSASAPLEELIPDSAVENPEDWAEQGVPAETAANEDAPPVIEPDAPMAPLPQVTVPWPENLDLPEVAELPPEEDIEFAEVEDSIMRPLVDGSEERLDDELVLVFPSDLTLFPERGEFLDRFESLSTIEELNGNGEANAAMLAARAREDEELLYRLLRIYGYYDPQVIRTLGGIQPGDAESEGAPEVRFDIVPGTQYRFGAIDLGMLDTTSTDYPGLRDAFGIGTGDPLLSDRIVEGRYDLDEALGETGYPFAAIEDPELLVDHARQEGDLTMPVAPGGKYRFGRVVSNMEDFLSSEHLGDIARFRPGDIYQRSLEMDLRGAILSTGLVAGVSLTPVKVEEPTNGEPGTVDIEVDMQEAPLRTISGSLGYGTGEGIRAEAAWEHRNLFPPEGMLRVRGIVGTREQLAGVTFRRNNVNGRDTILTIDAFAHAVDRDAYDANTVSMVATYERVSTLLFQKPLTWAVGIEVLATDEREVIIKDVDLPRTTYLVAALPTRAQIDTSDNLLDPKKGFRIGARVSPEVSWHDDSTAFYVKAQIDGSAYQEVSEGIVLAERVRFGTIQGAEIFDVAPSRRFYAGGGGSVRGYGYQAIGPRDMLGEPNGGRSLVEFSLEARIRTGMFDGALSVVPFVDAGSVDRSSLPTFEDFRIGAGIGIRYHTGFGPIRVDVGVPLNKRPDDAPVGVYVSLGQAF
jgi:translocation and assembly module TamA